MFSNLRDSLYLDSRIKNPNIRNIKHAIDNALWL